MDQGVQGIPGAIEKREHTTYTSSVPVSVIWHIHITLFKKQTAVSVTGEMKERPIANKIIQRLLQRKL